MDSTNLTDTEKKILDFIESQKNPEQPVFIQTDLEDSEPVNSEPA